MSQTVRNRFIKCKERSEPLPTQTTRPRSVDVARGFWRNTERECLDWRVIVAPQLGLLMTTLSMSPSSINWVR
jgi:hypothetical protein